MVRVAMTRGERVQEEEEVEAVESGEEEAEGVGRGLTCAHLSGVVSKYSRLAESPRPASPSTFEFSTFVLSCIFPFSSFSSAPPAFSCAANLKSTSDLTPRA